MLFRSETGKEIVTRTFETITIPDKTTTVKLAHKPANKDDVKFIYSIANGELGKSYTAGSSASNTEFVVSDDGTITLPTGLTGKIYVEYDFKTENAVRIVNKASKFPEAAKVVIYAIFRDACNENVVYSGVIVCPKAKFNPESVELALTSTGKHAFELNMMKDYCEDDGDLFTIIVNE